MANIKVSAKKMVEEIQSEAAKAEGQLKLAQPALDEAAAALNVRIFLIEYHLILPTIKIYFP